MKKILCLLFLFPYKFSIAQTDYIPFPLETGSWTNFEYQVGDGANVTPDVSYHYSTLGDTIIEALSYHKLVVNSDAINWHISRNQQVNVYVGAIREEERRVFFIPKDSILADTLYDFNIPIGTVWHNYAESENNNCADELENRCPYSKLLRVDRLNWVDGTVRRAYRFQILSDWNWGDMGDEYSFSWIEGIGSTTGFFGQHDHILDLNYATHSPHFWQELLCMQNAGELLYTGQSYEGDCNLIRDTLTSVSDLSLIGLEVYPNPSSGDLYIATPNQVDGLFYYWTNLQGEKISQTLSLTKELELQKLPKGLLFLIITDGGRQKGFKIVHL